MIDPWEHAWQGVMNNIQWETAQLCVKAFGSVDEAWSRIYRKQMSRASFRAWMKSGLI